MVSFVFSRLTAILTAFVLASKVACSPLTTTEFTGLDNTAREILERSQEVAAPHFVIYSDKYVSGLTGPPPVAQVKVRTTLTSVSFSTTDCNFSLRDTTSCK